MTSMPASLAPDGSGRRVLDDLLNREWLTVNHLGGYASSTACCLNTRKYHGLLVAAMAPPVRRLVLLSRVEETLYHDGWPIPLACNEYPGTIHPDGYQQLKAFNPEPFPRWAYQGDGWSLEKSLQLLRGQNTVVLTYTLIGASKPLVFELRPLLALRGIHELTYQRNAKLGAEEKSYGHYRVPPTSRTPEVFFAHRGILCPESAWYFNTIYRCEQDRGYAGLEDLFSPGVIRWKLAPGESVSFVCSADPIDFDKAVAEADRECAQLDSPIVSPPGQRDTDHDLLVRAAGRCVVDLPADATNSAPAMITKFPWAAPSAREALIALPGVLLITGKLPQAKAMLLNLASRIREGMIPTEFPEDGSAPLYNGADTSLWFINAVHQYLRYSAVEDDATTKKLADACLQIVRAYRHGAELGIKADSDGLLITRAPGCATTWMNAKIGDWVVTPRAGRPVELNALWYNAIRIAADLAERIGQPGKSRELRTYSNKITKSFNVRFWNEKETCCYDVIDDHGLDPSIRPNQLLAIALPYPVLQADRHAAVLDCVRSRLLTPVGPRTVAPTDPAYHGHYGGDVVARDRAYHQGCVHPWLLGPMVTAHLRVFGKSEQSRSEARKLLAGVLQRLKTTALGNVRELYDGDAPHHPNGATASAAVAGELLRCYVEDILDQQPRPEPAAIEATVMPAAISPKVTT